MATAPAKPPLPEVSPEKLRRLAANAQKVLKALPFSHRDARAASKLYRKKDQ